MTLANFDTIRIFVPVPEPDVPYVHSGSKATVRVDALPNHLFENRVSRLSGALDPSTRIMLAEIDLPNQAHLLHPGMLAKVTLDLQTHRNALTVPTSAVIFDKDKRSVFVIEEGKAGKVNVKTGFEESQSVEILDGLKGNEEVVIVGKENVENGSPVRFIMHHAGH